MAFKIRDHVVAAVQLASAPDEWPWQVPKGTVGYIQSIVGKDYEVRFDRRPNGGDVIRICKEAELGKAK